jgi:N-acetylhexosamine 1-kinase
LIKIDDRHIEHYWDLNHVQSVEPFGHGHINDTYLLKTSDKRFILQRVNKKVFKIPKLVSNYELLTSQVSTYQLKTGIKLTPDIFKTKRGVHHYIDNENFAWRLVEFIADAESFDISPDPEISFKAAQALGNYQLFLNTIDPKLPCDTIRGFHNLPGRLQTYHKILETCAKDLLSNAETEVSKIASFNFINHEFQLTREDLQYRVTHNDTKLNNTLFRGSQVFVIDLDTVMRGFVIHDYGDMVRTFCSPAFEDEKDIAKTTLRTDHFEALTAGYVEALKDELTQAEKSSLLVGALSIIFEQAIRFLTDYLAGNTYYKTSYPEHNLVRARTQIKLLDEIISRRKDLEAIIARHV